MHIVIVDNVNTEINFVVVNVALDCMLIVLSPLERKFNRPRV